MDYGGRSSIGRAYGCGPYGCGFDSLRSPLNIRRTNMDIKLYILHLVTGFLSGKDRTCGKKINYNTEEKAYKASNSMNSKPTTRNILEPYPCFFCEGWHIGKKMTIEFLESISNNGFS